MGSDSDGDRREPVRDTFTREQERTLSEAVLAAIEEYRETDLRTPDFVLYDHISPDALDELFPPDADSDAVLMFAVEDVRVTLSDNGGVTIEVTDRGPTGL